MKLFLLILLVTCLSCAVVEADDVKTTTHLTQFTASCSNGSCSPRTPLRTVARSSFRRGGLRLFRRSR